MDEFQRTPTPEEREEISLDPVDWDAFSGVAHRALDDAIGFLRTVRERPVWQAPPAAAREALDESLPEQPTDLDTVYAQFREAILPYGTGNIHPRFWGWVMGTGTADAIVAEMLATAMNPHLAGYDQSPALVERQVIQWLAQALGYGGGAQETSGLLVSGGTAANLTGLVVARFATADHDVRVDGAWPPGDDTVRRPRVYGSADTHSWLEKCCELTGLGRRSIRRVCVDRDGRMNVDALAVAVAEDRAAGWAPFCVVGTAGSVDVGATDDLEALADLCETEGMWFHIDGAFGALAALSPALRTKVRGMERADSVAFDLHKWGYLPYEVGCVLVRDGDAHRATFETHASYLESPGRGILPNPLDFANRGLQLSRGFRALKVWMALKVHGWRRIAQVIEQNVAQARYLAERVTAEPSLELLAPVPLNVVCFRFIDPDRDEDALTDLNREILLRLQEEGIAVVSSTWRNGRYALRLAITNHRSRRSDFDVLTDAVLTLGKTIILEAR